MGWGFIEMAFWDDIYYYIMVTLMVYIISFHELLQKIIKKIQSRKQ